MHKIFKRLMLTAALLTVPWVLQAQTHYTVAVGSGTDSSGYVPSYSWEYNFSQTIVRANEIGVDGVIDTIAFQVGSRNATRQLAIYMAELSKGSYSGGSDVVGGSHFQQVFSGTVTFSPGWVAIPLNNTFTYHDTADLIITVLDATGTYNSVYPYYRGTNSTDGYRSLYDYDMYDPYSLSSLPTDGTPSTFVPNIRLVQIAVVDMNGRAVASELLECSADCTKTLDVEHLAQGAYFVHITGENVNMVKKLIVR